MLLSLSSCSAQAEENEVLSEGAISPNKTAMESTELDYAADGFSDVPVGAWYTEAVAYAQSRGLMDGVGGGNFDPNGKLSRAMMVTVLYRAAGEPAVSGRSGFSDVRSGAWYDKAIAWAQENDIVNGYNATTFGVNDPLTREQMAAILWRYAGRPAAGSAGEFTDADSISGWAREAVAWAKENSVINGVGGNRFDPKGTASRAQLAQVLMSGVESGVIAVSDREEELSPETETPADSSEPVSTPEQPVIPSELKSIPAAYFSAAAQQGTLEDLYYDTWESFSYEEHSRALRKHAVVYLPYGYDSAKRYDIFYLMHGGWSNENSTLGTPQNPGSFKNVLDNAIQNGEIRPLIVVCPTYNNTNENGQDSDNFSLAMRLTRNYHNELINDLLPAVEDKYSTYGDRDHRGFGGFSMGSVTTWRTFQYCMDQFRYFLPMSCGTTLDDEEIWKGAEDHAREDYFVWIITGTSDFAYSYDNARAAKMRASDLFTEGTNFAYTVKEGYSHDATAAMEYTYNGMLRFWKGGGEVEASEPYTRDTKIADVMNDPAFGDYGRLIFPVNSSYYSGNTLGNLRLTWYNYIDPDKTVEVANYLKNHAEAGDTIFYDIYTEAEKTADPAKRNTGLFFFRGNPGEKFAICNAGGGFAYVGAMHDSFPHALELSKMGYNAFALIYRPGWNTAMEDLGRAIAFIEDNADVLGVDPDGYSLWGGSAGARMAATLGNSGYLRQYAGTGVPQAAAVIMQYTGHSETSANDAPTYANCGTGDGIASSTAMQSRLNTLTNSYGIPTEFHAYNGLPHGYGLGTGTVAEGWIEDAVNFWERQATEP